MKPNHKGTASRARSQKFDSATVELEAVTVTGCVMGSIEAAMTQQKHKCATVSSRSAADAALLAAYNRMCQA
jgi:hydroxyethylthiazole kinase-like sugar kinase family protein